ncbi:MAG: phage/plasmid primase, P4 family [Alphaproteobacteria bacterium]
MAGGFDGESRPHGKRSGSEPVKPADVARAMVATDNFRATATGTIYFYNPDRHQWRRIHETELNKLIHDNAGRVAEAKSFRAEVRENLAMFSLDADLKFGRVAGTEIPLKTGVLDLASGRHRSHNRDDMLERVLPHDYDPDAVAETWDRALVMWFGQPDGTLDSRAVALQEFAGYVLLPHARFKKALMMYGPGDTGKSEVIWMLQQLVGRDACCALSVDAMDDPVKLTVLRGKLLNVMSELSGQSLVRDSGFKTLVSTEEQVMLNPKYEPVEMYLPIAKHVIGTNEFPKMKGRTAEVFNRLLIVPMTQVVAKRDQDPDFRDKLQAELPGLFAWAVEGAKRLIRQRGQFTEPEGRAGVLDQWQQESNPVVDWLANHLRPREGNNLPLSHLAKLATIDLRRGVTSTEIGKAARERGLPVASVRPRSTDGKVTRTAQCVSGFEVFSLADFTDSEDEDDDMG